MNRKPLKYVLQSIPIIVLVLIIIVVFDLEKYNVIADNKEPDKTLVINEVLADNVGGLTDEDGDYTDWIEIYNYGQAEINIEGYGLSDDSEEPFKWTFPNMTIKSNDYIVIRTSGKDRKDNLEYLHSNFSIDRKGERLVLTHFDGEALDSMKVPKTEQNISFGRKPDGQDKYAILSKVTPGKPNYVNILENIIPEERLETPRFSHEAGFYEDEFELEITTGDKDITIYYTLDGSEPTINSKIYTKPIKIKSREGEPNRLSNIKTSEEEKILTLDIGVDEVYKGTIVKARAYKNGVFSNEIITNSYFINPHYILPIISIATEEDNLFGNENGIYVPGRIYDSWKSNNKEVESSEPVPTNYNQKGMVWEREASFEYFNECGQRDVKQNLGIRIFGGWSRMIVCKSMKLYPREQYGENTINYDFFDNGSRNKVTGEAVENYKTLLLRNSGNDFNITMFKDALMQSLVSGIGIDTQAYKPVIVFINGEYWGIHNIREAYDKYYIENHYNIDSENITILEASEIENRMILSTGSEKEVEDYHSLMSFIQNNDMSLSSNYEYVKEKIDIDNFIKYTICQIYFGNWDWVNNNMKIWKSTESSFVEGNSEYSDGRWRWMLFDLDWGFNNYEYNVFEDERKSEEDWIITPIKSLLKSEEFKNQFIATFNNYLDTIFEPSRVVQKIEEMAFVIAPEIEEHLDRWTLQDNFIGKVLHKIKGVEPYRTDWEEKVNKLKEFAEKRPEYIRRFLAEYFGE